MEALSSWFSVVPASDITAGHDRPTAAITLDDGYLDNLQEAVPVLRDLSLPATFFVVSDALEAETTEPAEFWWDRLEHLLLEPGPGSISLSVKAGRHVTQLDLTDAASRRASYGQLTLALQKQGPNEVRHVMAELEAARPRPPGCQRHRRMTAEQVQQLARDTLFDVGSHTCSHSALARLPRRESCRELTQSRDRLHALLGKQPYLLAYPYGAPGTVSRRNAREARSAGYRMAFANVPGPVKRANVFAVPRITVGRWTVEHLHRAVTAWRRSG
jgi:peptidoglycan/xylan/chitin deacetylase (PgdA/CDA1 family)